MQNRPKKLLVRTLDALPQAVLIADESGAILARNATACRMLPDGDRMDDVVRGGTGSPALNWQEDLTELVATAGTAEHRMLSLGGRGSRQLLADVYLRWVDDEPHHSILVVVQDVSPRVSTERRVAATERLSSMARVTARVAHELNNPLDGVMRYIGLAQRVAGDGAMQYLQSARNGLIRMSDIIRDLHDQAHSRGPDIERAPVDRLVDEAVATMQPRADGLGISVVREVEVDEPVMVGGNLYQVFCNVIKNAIDAMDHGGVLKIHLAERDGQCIVEFSDTGDGIDYGESERIFQPFYTTKPQGQGSGLGLAICREILNRMGGTIDARPGRDEGAVVTIRLPIRPPIPAVMTGTTIDDT